MLQQHHRPTHSRPHQSRLIQIQTPQCVYRCWTEILLENIGDKQVSQQPDEGVGDLFVRGGVEGFEVGVEEGEEFGVAGEVADDEFYVGCVIRD